MFGSTELSWLLHPQGCWLHTNQTAYFIVALHRDGKFKHLLFTSQ